MTTSKQGVPLSQLVEEFHLEVAFEATDYSTIAVQVDEVTRPGLPMAGYFEHFEPMRIQVLGLVEMTYLDRMTSQERLSFFDRLFAYKIPALVISRGQKPHKECLEMARARDITVLLCQELTSYIVSGLIASLKIGLAEKITRHGVLVEVYGEGLLILGESGIGKSETAVELLKRGHRLIADDAVEITRVSPNQLEGAAPALIRNYVELRGIGVVNVANLFGMAAIKDSCVINLVIELVQWDSHYHYDRLGLEENFIDLMGVKVPSFVVPVTPGRNLAVILEVAAMNSRQRRMGYNAAEEFTRKLDRHFEAATKEKQRQGE